MSDSGLEIGATVDLSELISILEKYAGHIGFEYFSQMATHFRVVANVPVRNVRKCACLMFYDCCELSTS